MKFDTVLCFKYRLNNQIMDQVLYCLLSRSEFLKTGQSKDVMSNHPTHRFEISGAPAHPEHIQTAGAVTVWPKQFVFT